MSVDEIVDPNNPEDGGGEREMGIRSSFADEGDGFEDEEDDENDEDAGDRSRRSLTRDDLDTASSVGRVQRQPARQPARRSSAVTNSADVCEGIGRRCRCAFTRPVRALSPAGLGFRSGRCRRRGPSLAFLRLCRRPADRARRSICRLGNDR